MFKHKIVLGVCFFAIAVSSLIGQEPATPPFRYLVSKIANDHVVLVLPNNSPVGQPTTFRVSSRLPGSDWIITSLKVRIEKRNGINRDISEMGLRDLPTGREFILKQGTENLTRRSSEPSQSSGR